ncbi:ArsR family transcriptional regulator [Sulfolobus sp. E5-1-F]|uniref:ArsR/SmtB family transcription factor n=1 Tax=Sulfolobaceae TaxID=118883 RepID=UPI001294D7D2|nr:MULTISPECIES: winged helix-turn-helix domain-containing protein [unclassified Sulfolobus]QGA54993.1 ArsR family transcriptional regulator [Sulfolobus sp. E5-1-F]QGA69616.1 ArsR family transcriptional regulator [Sulfolobus sp. E11-6]
MDLVIDDPEKIYEISKALSTMTRINILQLVSTMPMSITELTEKLNMSKGNISSHISELENLGLVEVEYQNGIKGIKKIIKAKYDKIIIVLKTSSSPNET